MSKTRLNLPAVASFYFGLFFVAVWIGFSQELFRFPSPGVGRNLTIAAHAGIGALTGGMILAVNVTALRFLPSLKSLARTLDELIGPVSFSEAFLLAAFSALAEEFFFRGVLQPYLGVVATSLAFGLLHTGPGRQFLAWTAFATLAGFLFGALYERTGDLVSPVAAHFIVNFVNLKAMHAWAAERLH